MYRIASVNTRLARVSSRLVQAIGARTFNVCMFVYMWKEQHLNLRLLLAFLPIKRISSSARLAKEKGEVMIGKSRSIIGR